MKRNGARFTVALVATSVLAACAQVRNPVEPEIVDEKPAATGGTVGGNQQSTSTIDGTLAVLETLLVGSEKLDVSFVSAEPAEGQTVDGDSLLVSVTDLLGGTLLGRNWSNTDLLSNSTTGSTTSSTGNGMAFKGELTTRTEKVTYSDGSTAFRTETTVTLFEGTQRSTAQSCRTNDQFIFVGNNPGGATTFTQLVQFVVTCPGSGRQFLLHLNLHFTTVEDNSGRPKVRSNVANTQVKGESGTS